MELTLGGVVLGLFLGGIIATMREEKKHEKYIDSSFTGMKFFWKRRDNKECTQMIIMDAIACGLDINKLIKEGGNSIWVYNRWYSYRNEGYFFSEDHSDKRKWASRNRLFKILFPQRRDKGTNVAYDFRPTEIPLEKYKHLKPGSGKDFGGMMLSSLQNQSFSPKDLKDD